MDRVGPENDMPWQLSSVHSQDYFLFCIIKEPKSYGKIILMVFQKKYHLGANGAIWALTWRILITLG